MPRKSTASNVSAGDEVKDSMGVEDLSLPRTMVQRLAKGVLPANTQIQKDAVLAISKSATVFVNYLASHAMENAARSSKKTIQPKDVFDALQELEFDNFIPRCQAELERYNTIQCDKRNSYRKKVREEAKAKEALEGSQIQGVGQLDAEGGAQDIVQVVIPSGGSTRRDEEPAAKKARKDVSDEGEEDEDEDETIEDVTGQQDNEDEDGDEDEEEEEDAGDEERPPEDNMMEDPLEEKEVDIEDEDEVLDGEESD